MEIELSQILEVWCDNKSAIALAEKPIFHRRTKHIEIDVHFVRDKITAKELEVKYVNNENQLANILTKALPTTSFEYFRSKLNVYLHSWSWEGELKWEIYNKHTSYMIYCCNEFNIGGRLKLKSLEASPDQTTEIQETRWMAKHNSFIVHHFNLSLPIVTGTSPLLFFTVKPTLLLILLPFMLPLFPWVFIFFRIPSLVFLKQLFVICIGLFFPI